MKADAPVRKVLEYMKNSPGVYAGYTTKEGGVPESPFIRMDLFRELGIENRTFLLPRQVHKTGIAVIGDDFSGYEALDREDGFRGYRIADTDGMVTDRRDVVLTTIHADCLAVLFYDPVHEAIGLCHAGWRGTADGIAVKTLRKMEEAYGTKPGEVYAAISAGISQCCFQVGEEVVTEFRSKWPFATEYVTRDDEGASTCTACGDMERLAESIRKRRLSAEQKENGSFRNGTTLRTADGKEFFVTDGQNPGEASENSLPAADAQDFCVADRKNLRETAVKTPQEKNEAESPQEKADAETPQEKNEAETPRYHMNLKGINKRQLTEMGVPSSRIEVDTHCTCCEPNLFWSYRRAGGCKERQGALLFLREKD